MNQPANPPIKTRFPRAAAIAVARELCEALKPHCERLIVAGSLRRMKQQVGDVEIVYIPKIRKYQIDLLKVGFASEAGSGSTPWSGPESCPNGTARTGLHRGEI